MDIVNYRLSRRTILGGLVASAGGAGAAAFGAISHAFKSPADVTDGSWWISPAIDLPRAGLGTWQRRIGNIFVVESEAGSATFTLAGVHAFPSEGERPDDLPRESAFALIFEGDRRVEGNRIYNVRHNDGGFDIYFGAADPTVGRPTLQAVFN